MVFARACAAHVSFCDFLAISFSSSYLTAIASFSTFHVSLALGTSLFLHVLDTCLSPAHVRNAILTRCILFSFPYAIVHLPLALLFSFLPFCTATCGHSEFCFGKHARPLHVEHSVHFDWSKFAYSSISCRFHVHFASFVVISTPASLHLVSVCILHVSIMHLSHIIIPCLFFDLVALQHLSWFYVFPRVSRISPVAVPWRIWVLTSGQTTCGLLHASSTSARAVVNLWLVAYTLFFLAPRAAITGWLLFMPNGNFLQVWPRAACGTPDTWHFAAIV
jgi:hypothetical protein